MKWDNENSFKKGHDTIDQTDKKKQARAKFNAKLQRKKQNLLKLVQYPKIEIRTKGANG